MGFWFRFAISSLLHQIICNVVSVVSLWSILDAKVEAL